MGAQIKEYMHACVHACIHVSGPNDLSLSFPGFSYVDSRNSYVPELFFIICKDLTRE